MGLTHLDAGVVIGYLDGDDTHHHPAVGALQDARTRRDHLAMSASAYAECLVAPARHGEETLSAVRATIAQLAVEVIPLGPDIAAAAAGLRAHHRSLRLPDALVIATAEATDADHLLTTDRRWPDASELGLGAAITVL